MSKLGQSIIEQEEKGTLARCYRCGTYTENVISEGAGYCDECQERANGPKTSIDFTKDELFIVRHSLDTAIELAEDDMSLTGEEDKADIQRIKNLRDRFVGILFDVMEGGK